MPFSWPFTRKVAKNNRSVENQAAYQSEYQARKNFGRGRQSRVANVMGLAKTGTLEYHDPFEAKRKEYAEIFLKDAKKKADSITPEQKQGVIDWANELKYKLSLPAGGGNNGPDDVTISVPRFIGNVLLFLIGFALIAVAVGAVFLEIFAVLMAPGGSSPGLSSMLMTQAFYFMGFSSGRASVTRNNRSNVKTTTNPVYINPAPTGFYPPPTPNPGPRAYGKGPPPPRPPKNY